MLYVYSQVFLLVSLLLFVAVENNIDDVVFLSMQSEQEDDSMGEGSAAVMQARVLVPNTCLP